MTPRKIPAGRANTRAALRDLGYPLDLPPLPASDQELITARLPGDWGTAAAYVRDQGIARVLKSTDHWGVGVGADERTDGPAVVFLAREGRRRNAGAALPSTATTRGRSFPVRELALAPELLQFTYGPTPLIRNTGAGGFTGSAVSNDPNAQGGGTLSGVFTATGGHSARGVTCAHVALGLGIQALLAGLPGSLGALFRSPSGQQMIVSGGPNIGQDMFRLFEVDTPWPILTFFPLALIPGVLTFLYVDIAAGTLRPTALPGGPPPPAGAPDTRTTIFGARLSHGTFPIPGAQVYKIGQTTGLTWGECILSSLFIPVPVPLLPVVVLFFVNLHRLAIAPGDSGALVTANPGQQPYDIDGLGLGGTAVAGPRSINSVSFGLPFPLATLFGGFRN